MLRKCPDILKAFEIIFQPVEAPWDFYELSSVDISSKEITDTEMKNDSDDDGMRNVDKRRLISDDGKIYEMNLKSIDEQILLLQAEIIFESIWGVQKKLYTHWEEFLEPLIAKILEFWDEKKSWYEMVLRYCVVKIGIKMCSSELENVCEFLI